MYEHRTHRLVTWPEFLRRVTRHLLLAFLIVSCAVGIGTVGYRTAGKLNGVDAFLNASMILGGMGPVDRMETTTGKMFAALYALFSGLVFIAVMGVVFAPWLHRLVHWMHLDQK